MSSGNPSDRRRREAARFSKLRQERDHLLMVLRIVNDAKQLPPNGPTQTLVTETLKRFEEGVTR